MEPSPPRPAALPARIPCALLGMLALIAGIELTLSRLDQPWLTTNAAMSWRYGGRQARSAEARSDVLCFGDSQVQFALLPKLIERQSGLKAYNLALHAAPPPASYFLLRRALAAGARPRAVVVDFQAHVLGMKPDGQARLWSEWLDPAEMLDLALAARSPSLFADLLCGAWLASYRDRHEIRSHLTTLLAGGEPSHVAETWLAPLWRNWRVNRGANIFATNPGHDATVPPGHWLAPDGWGRHRVPVLYMRRFLDLARAEGIPVFWILPPVHPAIRAERAARGLEDAYTRFVASVLDRYPEVVVLDARDRGYEAEVFSDLAHLDREGASVLSADVGTALARSLAGPASEARRWIPLPAYAPRARDPEVEDLDQSRIAIRTAR